VLPLQWLVLHAFKKIDDSTLAAAAAEAQVKSIQVGHAIPLEH